MPEFQIVSDFDPTGDQPQAVARLSEGLAEGLRHQTLLGVTGSGKERTAVCVFGESSALPTIGAVTIQSFPLVVDTVEHRLAPAEALWL